MILLIHIQELGHAMRQRDISDTYQRRHNYFFRVFIKFPFMYFTVYNCAKYIAFALSIAKKYISPRHRTMAQLYLDIL